MIAKKKVFIVEDNDPMRLSLKVILEACGFEVYGAGNAAEARRLAALHWEELDVVILDMRLDDPENPRTTEPNTTGADIGIEFRKKKKSFPPESLIYSDKSEIDFYRLALRLGAAAYLLKNEDDPLVVAQHVRVLALRRALNGENPKIAAEVARIATHSRSKPEAILTFCQRVLKQEFEICLGAPFLILYTDENTTRNCADNADLPAESSILYDKLQAYVHGKGNLTDPFILEAKALGTPPDQATARLYKKLNGAAFLPISLSNNLKLSIGILQQEQNEEASVPTDAKALCMVLAQYLRPTVLENIISIWSQWIELRATRNSTAKLCLSVGQEIKEGLETEDMEQLEDLADDLNDTGQLLKKLESPEWQDKSDAISVKEVVATTFRWIAEPDDKSVMRLDVRGDCRVQAQRTDLEIIFSRLLQWFAHRSKKAMPVDVEPVIRIECEASEDGATITFEDHSHRLPPKLRDDMFAPFTQAISTPFDDIEGVKQMTAKEDGGETPNAGRYLPLYLAKMLVEGRYHGLLEDHSDEIKERNYGHRILMQFPASDKMD